METMEYLVTDRWDFWTICTTKEKAEQEAYSRVDCDIEIEIFEIKKIGQVFIPDPDPVTEWL